MAPAALLLALVMLGGSGRDAFAGRLIFLMGGSPLQWEVKTRVREVPTLACCSTLLGLSGRIRCHDDGTGLCPARDQRGRLEGQFRVTNRGPDQYADLEMAVTFTNGAVCEFAGSVAALAGSYTCRDAVGTVIREDDFTFQLCRCHRGRVCRVANPCPF